MTSLNPPSATAGGQAFTLTVNGSGFPSGSTVLWNGSPLTPTTFVGVNQLTATVPASLIANVGSASVSVLTPNGSSTNSLTFSIGAATPNITGLNPNTVTAGSAGFSMLVTGTGFLSGANALWNGTSLATSVVSGTQLSVIIPANLITTAGTFNITVQNPNGSSSNAVAFIVTPPGFSGGTAGLAHYAVGSNWTTGIFVVNTGSTAAQYAISFFDDNGNPAAVPFASGSTTRLSGTLPPFGSTYLEASNPNGPLTAGWGSISADSSIVIQSLFRSTLNNTRYEAAVASSTGSRAFELPFDATNFAANTPLYTGIAIANLDTANTAQVSCIARDSSGNVIPNGVSIPSIPRQGHWAGFQFPVLLGQRGTLDCTSTTSVAVVALRFIGTDTFSSLPVIKK